MKQHACHLAPHHARALNDERAAAVHRWCTRLLTTAHERELLTLKIQATGGRHRRCITSAGEPDRASAFGVGGAVNRTETSRHDYLVVFPPGGWKHSASQRRPLDRRLCLGRTGDPVGVSMTEQPSLATLALDDTAVSRRHVELVPGANGWVLRDLGSKNGTFVNGARVSERRLQDKDVIECGSTFAIYRRARATSTDREDTLIESAFTPPLPGICTFNVDLERLVARLRMVVATRTAVLIAGEPGVGKRTLARAIHAASGRSGAIIEVGCELLPHSLSGRAGRRSRESLATLNGAAGWLGVAGDRSVLIDEIGALEKLEQLALLGALRARGMAQPRSPDAERDRARLLVVTTLDLANECNRGRFNPDLLAAICGHAVHLPPLRDRLEDVPMLIVRISIALGITPPPITRRAMYALLRYRWPMNLRELNEVVQTAIAFAGGGPVGIEHLPDHVRSCSSHRDWGPSR